MRLNQRFFKICDVVEAIRAAQERNRREFVEGQRQGAEVASLLTTADAEELRYEWEVEATTPLLAVADRAGAWAKENFDPDSYEGHGFRAGFVSRAVAIGAWYCVSNAQLPSEPAPLAQNFQ